MISLKDYKLVLLAGDSVVLPVVGNFVMLSSLSGVTTLNVKGDDDGDGFPIQVSQRARFSKIFTRIRIENPGGATATATFIIGTGEFDDKIFTGSVTITGTPNVNVVNTPSVTISGTPAVTVSGTATVSGSVSITGTPNVSVTNTPNVSVTNTPNVKVDQGDTLDSIADVSIAATTTSSVLASAATRRFAVVKNRETNTETVRVGDSGAGASNGVELAPGESIELWTTAQIYVYNPGAIAQSVNVLSVLD